MLELESAHVLPTPPPMVKLEQLGEEIAELSAHLDAATARLLDLIREFDARGGWDNGFRSCADWLSWRVGLDRGAARERVRVATLDTEQRLLKVARQGTAMHVERIVRGWRDVDRQAEAEASVRHQKHRALHVSYDEDGMVVLRGRLAPDVGALVLRAMDAARETLYQRSRADVNGTDPAQDVPTMEQQRADALALLAEAALHQGMEPGAPGERYQVVVHVDAAVLADAEQPGQCVLEDGVRVPAETSQRLACDASRVVLRHDADGRVMEIGARTRTLPPALRRALQHRDQGCRFPGCGLRLAEGHHIRHWAAGGPTTLSNMALLCRRHHRSVHEDGYRIVREPDGALEFRRPDGRIVLDVPPAPKVPDNLLDALFTANLARGVHIDADTSRPGWLGERLDVGWAIDVLHPRANPGVERVIASGGIEPT